MRIWIPTDVQAIATLVETGALAATTGFAVTSQWAELQGESDEEVLADLRAQSIESQIVVVADLGATLANAQTGEVSLAGPVSARQIAAFLAKSEPADDQFSWFGPTEGLNLLDFLGFMGK